MTLHAIPEIPAQLDQPGGAAHELQRKDAWRDPLAAPFALDAWPFRGHRTLAELDGEVT